MSRKITTYDPTGNFGAGGVEFPISIDLDKGIFVSEVWGNEVTSETYKGIQAEIRGTYTEHTVDELVPYYKISASRSSIRVEGWMLNTKKDFGCETGLDNDFRVITDLAQMQRTPRKIHSYSGSLRGMQFLPDRGKDYDTAHIRSIIELQVRIEYLRAVPINAIQRVAEMVGGSEPIAINPSQIVVHLRAIMNSFSPEHLETARLEFDHDEKMKEA